MIQTMYKLYINIHKYKPKITRVFVCVEVSAELTVPLKEIRTTEDQTVSLECETSLPGLRAVWLKDDKEIQSDEHCELLAEGCRHTMIVHKATLEDEAEYTIKIGATIMSKATLWVEGIMAPSLSILVICQ